MPRPHSGIPAWLLVPPVLGLDNWGASRGARRPMDRLLKFLLGQFVRRGTLRVTAANGSTVVVGDGGGRSVAVRFANKAAELGAIFNPELKLGEAYMDGSLQIEQGSIADFLAI